MQTALIYFAIPAACLIAAYGLRRLYLLTSAMESQRLEELAAEQDMHRSKASHEPAYGPAEMAKEFLCAAFLAVLLVACLILAFAY